MTQYPRLVFHASHNERTKAEMTLKGYVSHVWVETGPDVRYSVFFYDPVRLGQDLEAEARLGQPYIAEPGMIILPEVTEQAMAEAVVALHATGYFSHLLPDQG
jgi:hypothetical protein